MEEHSRRLVGAVLVVVVAVVAWVGWGTLRGSGGAPEVVVSGPAAVASVSEAEDGETRPSSPAPNAASPSDATEPARAAVRASTLRVHVAGAVRRSGVYALPAQARVIDAVKRAGGALPDADLEAINLADFLRDGEQIRVPSRRASARSAVAVSAPSRARPSSSSEPRPRSASTGGGPAHRTLGRYAASAAAPSAPSVSPARGDGPINVNTATAAELEALPGVGPSIAAAIVAYRREHGPFQHPEDLLNVRGIGEKKLARMRDQVRVR